MNVHQGMSGWRRWIWIMSLALCSMMAAACAQVPMAEPARVPKPATTLPAVALAPKILAANNPPLPAQAPVRAAGQAASQRNVAVILPTQSSAFKVAADAVRAGIAAAIERANTADGTWKLQLLETDDSPKQAADAFANAQTGDATVVIGPLPRNAVTAAMAVAVARPTVLLNLPEANTPLTGPVLAFSMALDAQARHVADAAYAEIAPRLARKPRALVVQNAAANSQALSRRIGAGFAQQFILQGGEVDSIDTTNAGAARIPERIKTMPAGFDLVFLALDAPQARVVRPFLPRELPVWGTSQLITGSAAELAELNDLRFADMPWLLNQDSPAVMSYPRPALSEENMRWYAFGIDAFRLAFELAQGKSTINLDGVTGRLRAGGSAGAVVERAPTMGTVRNGVPVGEGAASTPK